MEKMEIELTDAQLEKIEILKSKGISVGQAIDLLFEMQNQALSQVEEQEQDASISKIIKDDDLDLEIKELLIAKQHEEGETYDKTLQTTKHNIKWSEFFKSKLQTKK